MRLSLLSIEKKKLMSDDLMVLRSATLLLLLLQARISDFKTERTRVCVCSRCARRNGKQMLLLLLFFFRGLFVNFMMREKCVR